MGLNENDPGVPNVDWISNLRTNPGDFMTQSHLHRRSNRTFLIHFASLMVLSNCGSFASSQTTPVAAKNKVSPATMPRIGTVDPRFQSYNVEMVEVIGGRFWKPYGSKTVATNTNSATPGGIDPSLFEQRPPIDLANARLRKLATALGPVYIRVSGTWANTVFYQDSDAPAPAAPPEGFGGVLTRAEWKGVLDFSKAVNAEIVTSFATGGGTRDANGLWTPAEASKFVNATHAMGGKIAAAEFMNEPTFVSAAGVPKGYDGASYGRDYAVFQPFFRKAAPEAILLGPGSVGEGIDLAGGAMKLLPSTELLAAMGPNAVDAFSYHFYGGVSSRCGGAMGSAGTTTPGAALGDEWLDRTNVVEAFYAKLRDQYAPGKPMWVTETGQTACGGDVWASTFLDSFRYLNQLGALAQKAVQVVAHNTLAASDYALLDSHTFSPRPNYWSALLWHRLMGTTVLDPALPTAASVHTYAHCLHGVPGGVALLVINANDKSPYTLTLPQPSDRYSLSSRDVASGEVELNGKVLDLGPGDSLPRLNGIRTPAGEAVVAPASITFFGFRGANNIACK